MIIMYNGPISSRITYIMLHINNSFALAFLTFIYNLHGISLATVKPQGRSGQDLDPSPGKRNSMQITYIYIRTVHNPAFWLQWIFNKAIYLSI